MILEPLILVFIADKVKQELPVSWGVLVTFNNKVISMVAKIWHRLHVDDSVLDVDELLETESV